MRAFVTSIGEPTTELCVWALERQGFDVTLIRDGTTLAQKLKRIYNETDEDFVRVDADTIVNKNVHVLMNYAENLVWIQGTTFDWWKQDIGHGGVQFIRKEALPILRRNIDLNMRQERPESQMYRLKEFHNPRVCAVSHILVGLHGWGQNDAARVKEVKQRRGQIDNYDFELAERLNA